MNLAQGLSMLDPLAAWMATYCLHSTVLLGIAWAVTRGAGKPAVHEAIWRIALSAGILTAGFQHVSGGGSWMWPNGSTASPLASAGSSSEVLVGAPSAMAMLEAPVGTVAASVPWSGWWLAGFGLAACFGLLRLAVAAWHLRRSLRGRVELVDDPLRRELDDLLAVSDETPRRLRLTVAPSLDVPVALGVLRPEIAVPRWAVEALDPTEQRSLLAHELAHLTRGDTIWRPAAALVAALLPFQPLNHLAAGRLEHLSEDLADDWARRRSAGVALARCLTQAADHLLARRSLPVAAMASPSSDLGRRVQRLLAPPRSTGRSLPASVLVVAIALVALPMVTLAPGWATVPEAPLPEAPAVPPTPPEPTAPVTAPQPITTPSALEPPMAPELPSAPPAPASPRWPDRLDVAPRPDAPVVPRFPEALVAPAAPAAPRFPEALIAPIAPPTPRFAEPIVAPPAPRFAEPVVVPVAPAVPVPTIELDAPPAVPRAPEPLAVPWAPRAPVVPEAIVPWVTEGDPDAC
ncbi:MAG: M56 family metallopeptidase [Acidobacteriota bacterium]